MKDVKGCIIDGHDIHRGLGSMGMAAPAKYYYFYSVSVLGSCNW